MKIRNPILPGFNPDPSICRVGEDYYIATSTFEWYPGVQIHQSRDLKNWQLVSRPLNRAALLDMRGNPDSCGVYAPCLSWHDGVFWLAYTNVRRFDGNFKDCPNYLTTCDSVDGTWSDPVFLNAGGFDPSFFHDGDGRKWYTNMVWDHRPDRSFFRGLALQEYSESEKKLLGRRKIIFNGTALDCTEGPHQYRFGDYYYLITAEGGTGYGHAVTMVRSENVDGPYEPDPAGPVITSRDSPDWPLQRAGHGDVVETPDGQFYLVHLCSRPLADKRRSPLGRESAIQKLVLTDDGWLRPAHGDVRPAIEIDGPDVAEHPLPPPISHDDFDRPELDIVYQWLRSPYPEAWLSLTERPGHLRLKGRESMGSLFEHAFIARRQIDFVFRAETKIEFEPEHFQQQAGLAYYYNSHKFFYLYISTDRQIGKHLGIMACEGDTSLTAKFPIQDRRVQLPSQQAVCLAADVDHERLYFSWSIDGDEWQRIDAELDASLISDEAGKSEHANFTGAFIGICCQDIDGTGRHADFDYFSYRAGG